MILISHHDCFTEQATTCAHCLNLVFIVFGSSPGVNMVRGLPTGEERDKSLSEDVANEDEDIDFETVS